MKKVTILITLLFGGGVLFAQTNLTTVSQEGANQVAFLEQTGTLNTISIQQISNKTQSAWVYQSGEMEDETTGDIVPGGESNLAAVDQTYSGNGNKSFLNQYGSFNSSYQKQDGNGNEFNIVSIPSDEVSVFSSETEENLPNQDGDNHTLSQIAVGNFNQAWIYQAGRQHTASQYIEGNTNEVLTTQSGNTQTAEIVIYGNRNGSHYLEHEEGKFPHAEDEEHDEGGPSVGGNGNCKDSGGNSETGGMPDEIPPSHDDDHEFVPSVSVAIKQMGKNSQAYMFIQGNDNKATITQRGGSGGQDAGKGKGNCGGEAGGHLVDQDIYGDWNRVFASQMGKTHTSTEYVNGNNNLVLSMQRGNSNYSDLDVIGGSNEIGIDQKGKGNISVASIDGFFNGNFIGAVDEYAVKLTQEGKENQSGIQISGSYNMIAAHQAGGGISTITQTGDWHSATLNQASIDEH